MGDPLVHAWLADQGAQNDLVEWAKPFAEAFTRLWEECPRGDWLLAIAARLEVNRRALIAGALRCAKPGLEYVPEEESSAETCVRLLEDWMRGADNRAQLALARDALMQAHAGAQEAASAEALLALVATLDAVEEPAAAAGAAAFAAHAAMLGAGDCAMVEALRFAQRMQADSVRAAIDTPDVVDRFRAQTKTQAL